MRNIVNSADDIPIRLDTLTGLRFFASLAVVLFHLQGRLWLPEGVFQGIPLNQGVSFFYVLSGFILQHSYCRRLGSDRRGITTGQFIVLRFFRLWPCHIAVILLIIISYMIVLKSNWILLHFLNTFSIRQIFSAVFLLQAWHPDIKVVFALNSPAWSISVEMFFYVMFPLLSRQAIKSPIRPMFYGAAITIFWLSAVWLYMPSGNFMTLAGTNPLARIFEFSVGVSAYEYFAQSKRLFRSGTCLELGMLALSFLSVATTRIVSSYFGAMLGEHVDWWLMSCASCWTFAILIGIFSWQEGRVSRLLGWKPMVYFGEISFALYLVHQPVIQYLEGLAPWFHQLPLPMQVMAFAIIILGISSALHHLIEKPCMALAKRLILSQEKPCWHECSVTGEER